MVHHWKFCKGTLSAQQFERHCSCSEWVPVSAENLIILTIASGFSPQRHPLLRRAYLECDRQLNARPYCEFVRCIGCCEDCAEFGAKLTPTHSARARFARFEGKPAGFPGIFSSESLFVDMLQRFRGGMRRSAHGERANFRATLVLSGHDCVLAVCVRAPRHPAPRVGSS